MLSWGQIDVLEGEELSFAVHTRLMGFFFKDDIRPYSTYFPAASAVLDRLEELGFGRTHSEVICRLALKVATLLPTQE